MPIPTPTSSPNGDPTGELNGARLPNVDALAQLANEFFRRLPTNQDSLSTLPSETLPVQTPMPNNAVPNSIPDALTEELPGNSGRLGGAPLGVPEAYAAALPTVSSPTPFTSAPYYFLAEASVYTGKVSKSGADWINAQPDSLPGVDDLHTTLATITVGVSPSIPSGPGHPSDSSHQFYFLDPAGTHTGYVPDPGQKQVPHFDGHTVRSDFPVLHQKINGKPLIWLDSAATSQKPQAVIDAEAEFYERDNSNIHRAAHALAARATDAYEGARKKVQHFLGAELPDEIVFVRGTTEAINLLAQTCGRARIGRGDEIILTTLEHHANIVPWQMLAQEKGAVLKVVPIEDSGDVLLDSYARLLNEKTRIVALTHVSNTLGTVVPVEIMTAMAHQVGAAVVVDGAQSVPHFRINVRAIDCDFFVFSGHKLFAPTGIGVLYGKKAMLDAMPPWQGGGNMIDRVTFEHTTYNIVPYKFEAGTGNIGGAVGLGAAIDYLNRIGFEAATHYEDGLLAYALQGLSSIRGVRLFGTAPHKVGVASFELIGVPPEEVGKFLDKEGIAVRAGHHCAQPTMQRYGVSGMVRPSFAFYNTYEEVDALITAVHKARKALT